MEVFTSPFRACSAFSVRIITGMDRNGPEHTGIGIHNRNGYQNYFILCN